MQKAGPEATSLFCREKGRYPRGYRPLSSSNGVEAFRTAPEASRLAGRLRRPLPSTIRQSGNRLDLPTPDESRNAGPCARRLALGLSIGHDDALGRFYVQDFVLDTSSASLSHDRPFPSWHMRVVAGEARNPKPSLLMNWPCRAW